MAKDEPSHADIVDAIDVILEDADLSVLSAKQVRKELEKKFDTNLTDRKKEIDNVLMKAIDKKTKNGSQTSEDGHSSDEKEEPVKKKAKSSKVKVKSQKEVTSDLSDDDKVDDEKLAKKLQEEENGRRTRAVKKTKKVSKKDPEKKTKRSSENSFYKRPCQLSPELAEVLGVDKMPRSDVVKSMWQLIKDRNLKDPKNGQFTLCDEQLTSLFGVTRLRTFGMMKHLSKHITNIQ